MTTRAKFRVDSIKIDEMFVYDPEKKESVKKPVATITLRPVTGGSKENEEFYASTPGGMITLAVVNMPAAVMFKEGNEIYVDFTAVEEATASQKIGYVK